MTATHNCGHLRFLTCSTTAHQSHCVLLFFLFFRFLALVPPVVVSKKTLWQTPPRDRDERAESNTDCAKLHQNFVLLYHTPSDWILSTQIKIAHIEALTPQSLNWCFSTVIRQQVYIIKLFIQACKDWEKWPTVEGDELWQALSLKPRSTTLKRFALILPPVVWNQDRLLGPTGLMDLTDSSRQVTEDERADQLLPSAQHSAMTSNLKTLSFIDEMWTLLCKYLVG